MDEVVVDVAVVDEERSGPCERCSAESCFAAVTTVTTWRRRVWNGNIDRRPALIARCRGVVDVQRSLAFAVEHGLVVSVRGGGHSAPGYGTNDGGMVIDLGPMKGIRVDPSRGSLWRRAACWPPGVRNG